MQNYVYIYITLFWFYSKLQPIQEQKMQLWNHIFLYSVLLIVFLLCLRKGKQFLGILNSKYSSCPVHGKMSIYAYFATFIMKRAKIYVLLFCHPFFRIVLLIMYQIFFFLFCGTHNYMGSLLVKQASKVFLLLKTGDLMILPDTQSIHNGFSKKG